MSLKKDWNYVKSSMRTPCNNGDVGIYIETGIVAAGIAAMDVVSFGCREPLKWALGRGQVKDFFGTKSRGINNPFKHRKGSGRGKVHPGAVSAGPSIFWGFEGLLERTMYLMMLVGVGKDFALNWTSLLMAANGCGGPYQGFCQFNIVPQIIGPNPTEMLIAPTADCHGVISDIRHIYIPLGVTSSVGYHANSQPWTPAGNPNSTLSSYIADVDDGKAWGASQQGSPGSGDNGVVGFQRNLPGRTATFRKLSIMGQSSGYSWVSGGKIDVTLSGHPVHVFHPQDCFKGKNDTAFDKWLKSAF